MVPSCALACHSYDLALSPLPEGCRELASACTTRCARSRCGGHWDLVCDGRLRDGVVNDVLARFGRDAGRLHACALGEPADLLLARCARERAARLRRRGNDRPHRQLEGGRPDRRAHRYAGKRRRCGRARCGHGEPVDPDRRAACCRAHGGRRRFRGYRVRRRRDLRPRQGGDGRDEASFHRLAGRAVPKHESRCADEARALGRPHRAVEFPARGRRRPHHAQPRENLSCTHGRLFVRAQAHGVNLGFVRHEPGRQGGLRGEGVEAFRGIRPGRHDRLRQDRHAYRGATPGEMRYRARRMEPDPGPSLRGVLGRALPASRRARRRSRCG